MAALKGIIWMVAFKDLQSLAQCPRGDSGIQCTLRKFAINTKLSDAVEKLEVYFPVVLYNNLATTAV